MLVLDHLSFRYRDRQEFALRDINLTVEPGELLLVAGASGCGKTTLIRCINGLIPRSYKGELQGKVLIKGQDVSGLPLARISQMVGTVLQDPERQILGSRVINEVAFGLENLGLPRAEIYNRVMQSMEYLRITHLKDRETFHLSGGEKQKVALAGVLAMRPSLLLLDEPLASLDPASAQEAMLMARRLVDEGITLIIIEHRVEDVLKINPDRIMYMTDGQVRYLGDLAGMSSVVDYREIKMPAEVVLQHPEAYSPPVELHFLPSVPKPEPGVPREPLVQFEDVSFGYELNQSVLKGINLSIFPGDIIAVLGHNGAGKTTLVKHAIGLLKPKAGVVKVNGKDTREQSVAEVARTVGYVFQSPSHMLFAPTVREELAFGPTNLGYSAEQIKKHIQEAIEIVNLAGRENDPPLALSFGQQKRVSIAAILAMKSRILVMDEPTAGQDYKNYMNFMDSILQLPGFEAVLFITHDVDLAVIYANRVWLVGDGRVVADGDPQKILSQLDLLKSLRLVPTTLLEENLKHYEKTGRFLRAEALAQVLSNGRSRESVTGSPDKFHTNM